MPKRNHYLSSKGEEVYIPDMNFMRVCNAGRKIIRDGEAEERAQELADLQAQARAMHAAWIEEHPGEEPDEVNMEWTR